MDEEKETEQSTDNSGDGNQSQELTDIERANVAAERLEKANKAQKELIDRQEALDVQRKLGGRSEGGIITPESTIEEKKQKNAEDFFEGTELGDAIKKANE
jgi:hypothetical protein